MATGGSNGYQMSLFGDKEVDPQFICGICKHGLMEPVQTKCGHRFCWKCIYGEISTKETCPTCQTEGNETSLKADEIFPDNAIKREMSQLKVTCDVCSWSGTLKELDKDHWKKCYPELTTSTCFKINETYPKGQITTDQDTVTALQLQVHELIRHTEELNKKVDYYESYLSNFTKEINKNFEAHFHKISKLETNQKASESQEIPSWDGQYLWKIDNYCRRKRMAVSGEETNQISPPFYTSRYGYKLRARVNLNGNGMGKGTHMSVYLYVCKGSNDALLQWPFKQRVTFKLFNQNGRGHIIDDFRPDPNDYSFMRQNTDQNIGRGIEKFHPQARVEKDFVKDDTMFLLIKVECNGLQDPAKSD